MPQHVRQRLLGQPVLAAVVSVGEGATVIARQLVLSPKTVRNHISNIVAKLQVQARAEAIVRAGRARRAGLGQ
jgi:DNA-binding NarL/FixJ family response regulator